MSPSLFFGRGQGLLYYRVRFPDGYNTSKSMSVLNVQLQRAFEDHPLALGVSSEETKTVHAQAFVKLNGAKTGQRPSKHSHGERRPTGSTGGATTSGSTGGATTSPGKNTYNRDTTQQMRPLTTYSVMLLVFTIVHLRSHSLVITKNVDQGRGIVNATCGILRGWETPTRPWMRQETKTSSRENDLRGLS